MHNIKLINIIYLKYNYMILNNKHKLINNYLISNPIINNHKYN